MRLVLFFALIVAMLASCSTSKNTAISRSYHNLTAHYNAYFNGREAFKAGHKRIISSHTDDFNHTIPVYPFTVKSSAQAANSDMETAKKKASKVIKKHSITAKPKRRNGTLTQKERDFYNKNEYCEWVDDSWLLNGKALFYQHDWYGAEAAFEYLIKEFSNEPIRYEAGIWIARTYTQMKKFNDALSLLQTLEGEKDFPKKLRKDLATSFADVYINQKKYADAISWLEKSVKLSRKKKEKVRYLYILAQLYQQQNNFPRASQLYGQVIKTGGSYDMIFNAQINRATSIDQGMNTAQVKKQLNKMLKDDKNIDFQDQIYYALGKIYLKERNEDEAIKAFRKSAQTSVNNQQQKAISYLEMANIYYDRQKYLPAQNYYDSCLAFLDAQYPGYNELASKSKNLNELAVHLVTIINEDSLQRIADMPERERYKIIDKIIQDIIAEEERMKLEEQQQQMNSMMYMQNQMNQQNQQQAGKWYFYNPGTVSYGMGEFRRKWGNRKLEDNWRRKNKAVVAIVTDEDELAAIDSAQMKANDKKSRDYYLQGLPLTDSLKQISNKRIEEALFASGEIYMNLFRNYNHAIESFETLNTRFPATDYQLISWYDLYRLNLFVGNNERAEYYKQLIIQKHSGSNYANMLSNPNYLKEIEEKQGIINELYEQAYTGFKRNRFNSVFSNYNKADSLMATNPVMTKFSLLKALSYGGIGNLQEMKNELRNVIEKYPGTDEKSQAEVILAMIEKGDYSYLASRITQNEQPVSKDTSQTSQLVENNLKEEPELYKVNDEEPHVFALVYPYKSVSLDQLRFNLFSFNTEFFIMFDFEVQNVRLDDTYSLITIRPFPGKREVTRYYKSAAKHREIITRKLDDRHIRYFAIPESLLKEVSESKEFDTYIKFFEKKYLQKKSK